MAADDTRHNDSAELSAGIERLLHYLTPLNVMSGLSLVLLFIAWNRGIALLYGLLALLLATLLCSWLAPRLMLRNINVQRHYPDTAVQDQPLDCCITIVKPGWFAAQAVQIIDPMPFVEDAEARVFLARCQDSERIDFSVPCWRRGVFTLSDITLASDFPLGIFTATRAQSLPQHTLVIYPSTFPIAVLILPGGSDMARPDNNSSANSHDSDTFLKLRHYQRGDSPKRIHWPASARLGQLMTKEFEDLKKQQVCLVLNLNAEQHAGEGVHSSLEYMVKIAASIAHYALDNDNAVSLIAAGADDIQVEAGTGLYHMTHILEALALVEAVSNVDYADCVEGALARYDSATCFLCFDLAPDGKARSDAYLRIQQLPVPQYWVSLDTRSFALQQPAMGGQAAGGDKRIFYLDDLAQRFSE